MANFKHKVFLLIAKWIPVAVAAGILINNTLVMLDVKIVICLVRRAIRLARLFSCNYGWKWGILTYIC